MRVSRGVQRKSVSPRKKQIHLCERAISCWLNARLVVISESEWAWKAPHARPRVKNLDLIANRSADPGCGKEEARGWLFQVPECLIDNML